MSTHNLYFGSKIRKIGIPQQTPFSLYKRDLRGYLLHGHVILMQSYQKLFHLFFSSSTYKIIIMCCAAVYFNSLDIFIIIFEPLHQKTNFSSL